MHKPPTTNGSKPEWFKNRRSCLSDALTAEGLIMLAIQRKDVSPLALSSLVQSFCRLVPIVMALRGRPLMLHGSVTKRLDMTPKEAARQLKQLKSVIEIPVFSETPVEASSQSAPAIEPWTEKNVKGIS